MNTDPMPHTDAYISYLKSKSRGQDAHIRAVERKKK